MAWTYIVECADGSYYVGSTTDLDRRIWEHNEGVGAAYTRRRRPVELVWCAQFARVDEAFAFEKRVQGWGRAKRQALIEGRTEDLGDLASRSWAARKARGALRTDEPAEPTGLVTVARATSSTTGEQPAEPVEEVAQRPDTSVVEEVAQRPDTPVVEEVAQRPDTPVVEEVAQRPSRDPEVPSDDPWAPQ
ncbi:GIY-YIG nuclease family protein [Nocardioides panacisoli]|uniref:GIY-YIG domain-containing protein n=1 Tax=Nocardioides panacisoli TaxID=627624 RepID=A0ABP7J4H0_9ACTN